PRTWSIPKTEAKDWGASGQSMAEAAERFRRGCGMDDGDRVNHDRRWHAAVQSGDDAAWRRGYDAAYDAVRAYVNWRCAGLSDLVDDIVQDTWLTAVRRIANYEPGRASFATWVCGIAGNAVRNALRNRRRRAARVEALVGDP